MTPFGTFCRFCKRKLGNDIVASDTTIERHFQKSRNCFGEQKPDMLNLQRKLQADLSVILPQMKDNTYSNNLVNSFFGEPAARKTKKSPSCSNCGKVGAKRDLQTHFRSKKNDCTESCLVEKDVILNSQIYKNSSGNDFQFPLEALSKIMSCTYTPQLKNDHHQKRIAQRQELISQSLVGPPPLSRNVC